jgi:hypothetical protein
MSASNDVPPLTQWATVHKNDKFVAIEPLSGYWQALPEDEGRVLYLESDAMEEALGRALLTALGSSRFFHPCEEPRFFDAERYLRADERWHEDFMARFGYKTLRQAYQNMCYCRVRRREGKISIRPHRRDKPRYWIDLPQEMTVVIPASLDAAATGAALKLALSRCE